MAAASKKNHLFQRNRPNDLLASHNPNESLRYKKNYKRQHISYLTEMASVKGILLKFSFRCTSTPEDYAD